MQPASEITPTLDHIARAARHVGKLERGQLTGCGRMKEIVIIRQVVHYLSVTRCNRSTWITGKFFRRDHSTIIYSIRRIAAELNDKPNGKIARLVEKVWLAACDIAAGRPVERPKKPQSVVVELKPRPALKPQETENLKHWSHYPICSPEWWRANELAFRQAMMKHQRARVYLEAGE